MKTDPNIRFHLKALAASGDKHARNIVKGLELLNWPRLDRLPASNHVETIVIGRPDPDIIEQVKALGWKYVGDRNSAPPAACYFCYYHGFTIHV